MAFRIKLRAVFLLLTKTFKCFWVNANDCDAVLPISANGSLLLMVNVRHEIIFLNIVSFFHYEVYSVPSNWCLYGVHCDDQRPEAFSL